MHGYYMRQFSRFLVALLLSTSLAYAAKPVAAEPKPSESSTYELLNLFGEVFDRVRADRSARTVAGA